MKASVHSPSGVLNCALPSIIEIGTGALLTFFSSGTGVAVGSGLGVAVGSGTEVAVGSGTEVAGTGVGSFLPPQANTTIDKHIISEIKISETFILLIVIKYPMTETFIKIYC